MSSAPKLWAAEQEFSQEAMSGSWRPPPRDRDLESSRASPAERCRSGGCPSCSPFRPSFPSRGHTADFAGGTILAARVAAANERILVLQDFALSRRGTVAEPSMPERMHGREGSLVTAAGAINPVIAIQQNGLLRLRVINASSSRFYRLRLACRRSGCRASGREQRELHRPGEPRRGRCRRFQSDEVGVPRSGRVRVTTHRNCGTVGDSGKLICVDIQYEMLSTTHERLLGDGQMNVGFVRGVIVASALATM